MHNAELPGFRSALVCWYRRHQRRLPWRETDDSYAIWVSEVMLQQTQVKTVVPFYRRFMEQFPDIERLATADLQEVLKCWEGLGYYARARNLHRGARMVCERFGGLIPDNRTDIGSLPGVGDYIASAVLSIAFKQAHAVVDGNVKRVLARLDMIAEPVNHSASHKHFKRLADRCLDPQCPDTYNQALMELGALVCKPKSPQCDRCPVNRFCRAQAAGQVDAYPQRLAAKSVPRYHIAVGVVQRNGRLLITRRQTDGLLGGLWEFPGGKRRPGETPEAACLREIAEEVNLKVALEGPLARVKHAYTHFRIVMDVFWCRYLGGDVVLDGPADFRWILPGEIDVYPFPKANHKFMPQVRARFCDSRNDLTKQPK